MNLLHYNCCKPPTCRWYTAITTCRGFTIIIWNKFFYFHVHLLVLFSQWSISTWSWNT